MLPIITFLHMLMATIMVAAFAIEPAPLAFEIATVTLLCLSTVGHIVAFRSN